MVGTSTYLPEVDDEFKVVLLDPVGVQREGQLAWGASLLSNARTPPVGELGGGHQYDFPPSYGKWAASAGMYSGYHDDHFRKRGAELTFQLGDYYLSIYNYPRMLIL